MNHLIKTVSISLIWLLSVTGAHALDQDLSTTYSEAENARVLATGYSDIAFGDIQAARQRALRDAIESASLQVNARVHSTQVLEDGALTVDHLRINSSAQVQDLEVIDEYERDGQYIVEIMAWVSAEQVCATGLANGFRKTLAVTGFPMQDPKESTLGHLGSVDRSLASHLVNQLNGVPGIEAMDANYLMLYPTAINAPTRFNNKRVLTKAVDAAREFGVQFVVSGVIRDLSIRDQNAPYARPWDQSLLKVGLNKDKRLRQFVLDVYVHDGYSGALVMQSRYSAEGLWNVRHHEKVGFGTGKFWATDYGRQVESLIAKVVADVHQTIQCQPFMAKITQVDQRRIYVSSGASSGLRPGDRMAVYRTLTKFDRQQNEFVQIADTKLMAEITQVQPHFSIAELPVRTEQLNLQADDIVIAW